MGFVYTFQEKVDVTIMTMVSGSIIELIAGTSFWLHNKSIKELNKFHKRLSSTERYLTSIMLVEKIKKPEGQDSAYRWILENCILTDVEIQTGEILKWRHESKNN